MSIVDAVANIPTNANLTIKIKDAESQISVLHLENEALKSSSQEKDEKIRTLEKQIIEIQNNPLTFDDKTGTWQSSIDNFRYCAKCKIQNIPSPLKNEKHGWFCSACETTYPDPDRPKIYNHKPQPRV